MPIDQEALVYRETAAAIREMAVLLKTEPARNDALLVAAEWDRIAAQAERATQGIVAQTAKSQVSAKNIA